MLFSTDAMRKAARLVQDAERVHVENQVLQAGLRLGDDEYDEAVRIADLAIKSGDSSRFLLALVAMSQPDVTQLLLCMCWWCRFKRWLWAIGQKRGCDG